MNIPNDGGWGKAARQSPTPQLGQGSGVLETVPALWRTVSHDWLLLGCLALVGIFCFSLGFLAARENNPPKDPLWIEQLPPEELPGSISSTTPTPRPAAPTSVSKPTAAAPDAKATLPIQAQHYVASKTGSKYYLSDCAGAKRIKYENKVWFATKELAAAAGYQPAANCKGL